VVIQAHRLHAECFAQLARAETREAIAIDLHQRLRDDALARQRHARGSPARAARFQRRRSPQFVVLSVFHSRADCNLTP